METQNEPKQSCSERFSKSRRKLPAWYDHINVTQRSCYWRLGGWVLVFFVLFVCFFVISLLAVPSLILVFVCNYLLVIYFFQNKFCRHWILFYIISLLLQLTCDFYCIVFLFLEKETEFGENLETFCVLNLLPEVSTQSSLVAIYLVKNEI